MSEQGFPKNSQDIDAAASPETQMDENFQSIDYSFVCAVDPDTTTGSTIGWLGGRYGGTEVAAGTDALRVEGSPTPSNYMTLNRATKAVEVEETNTKWNATHEYARIYRVYTNASGILIVEDHRAGPHGLFGYRTGLTWNAQTDNYTLAEKDGGNGVKLTAATAKTITVPPTASIALWSRGEPVRIMQGGAGQVTVAGDTGVTIRARESGSPTPAKALAGQWAIGELIPDTTTTDQWIWAGDIL
jgi:hypothetical protein